MNDYTADKDDSEENPKKYFRAGSAWGLTSTPSSSATFDTSSVGSIYDKIISTDSWEDLVSYVGELKDKKPKINKEKAIGELHTSFLKGDLTFIFGSGISQNKGLPDWDTLLHELFAKAVVKKDNEKLRKAKIYAEVYIKLYPKNPLITARYVRQNIGKTKSLSLESKTKSLIYKHFDGKSHPLFEEIVNFCDCNNGNSKLDSIITYNYDNFIEYFCDKRDPPVPYRSIYSNETNISEKSIPIYHVHGYLPKDERVNSSNQIVLSEESYHEQYSEIYKWSNLIQIEKFMHKKCLFIGVSFNDPNLRRLLEISHEQMATGQTHYYINKREESELGIKIENILRQNPNIVEQKDKQGLDLTTFKSTMIDLIYEFEETDLKSFGVDTIWIDDWNEIPEILKKIRTG